MQATSRGLKVTLRHFYIEGPKSKVTVPESCVWSQISSRLPLLWLASHIPHCSLNAKQTGSSEGWWSLLPKLEVGHKKNNNLYTVHGIWEQITIRYKTSTRFFCFQSIIVVPKLVLCSQRSKEKKKGELWLGETSLQLRGMCGSRSVDHMDSDLIALQQVSLCIHLTGSIDFAEDQADFTVTPVSGRVYSQYTTTSVFCFMRNW